MNDKSFAPRGCLAVWLLGLLQAPRKRMEWCPWPSTFEYLVVCGYDTAVYLYISGVVYVQLRKSLSGVLGKSDLLNQARNL